MPLDTNSDTWEAGDRYDPLEVHISSFLRRNQGQAFTVAEITRKVVESDPEGLFLPEQVDVAGPDDLDPETYRQVETRVAAKLEELNWRQIVEWRTVDSPETDTRRAYFTWSDDEPINPISAVYDRFPPRFEEIEDELNNHADRIDGLQRTVERLQREVR